MNPGATLQAWLGRAASIGVTLARDGVSSRLRSRLPASWRRVGRQLQYAGSGGIQGLEDKLWGGYSRSAIADLQAIKADAAAARSHRGEACFSLARWHASQKDYVAALDEMAAGRAFAPWRAGLKRHYLPEALWLCHVGRTADARELIARRNFLGRFDSSVELVLANTWNAALCPDKALSDDGKVLDHVNAVFRRFGLSPLAKRDPNQPLSMDNIRGVGTRRIHVADRAVSVIVPLFNAADTMETALRSISEQTWNNLSVIIVDDASTDDTAARARDFCARDARFRLIEKPENSGTYASRNLALAHVETPFVTVHDGDDWSHPEKIERQIAALYADGSTHNYTMWARATSALGFVGNLIADHRMLGPDYSAGLFRTETLKSAGGWDSVRVSADTELLWRLEALAGRPKERARERRILDQCPLAFGRQVAGSLTQTNDTSTSTILHGVRREYREAAEFWHTGLQDTEGLTPPFFPAPSPIRPAGRSGVRVDLLLIADFNGTTAATERALHIARSARRAGKSVAIFHYPAYHADVRATLSHGVRRLARDEDIWIIAPGEPLAAHRVVVCDSALLAHRIDRFPKVDHDRLVVLTHRLPGGPADGAGASSPIERVVAHVEEFFGHRGEWVRVPPHARGQARAPAASTGAG